MKELIWYDSYKQDSILSDTERVNEHEHPEKVLLNNIEVFTNNIVVLFLIT